MPIRNETQEPDSPRIKYFDHRQGAQNLIDGAVRLLSRKNPAGGLLLRILLAFAAALRGMKLDKKIRFRSPLPAVEDFPEGMGLANEEILLDTHSGTHLDAPWHFGPAVAGARARRIDEMPLEW
ncbi:MAG: cyclase family protein, partial [Endomicrobiales bacterium]